MHNAPPASGRSLRWAKWFFGVLFLVAIGGGSYWAFRQYENREELPDLPVQDLNEASGRTAGKVDRFNGQAFMRTAIPSDTESQAAKGAAPASAPAETLPALTAVRDNSTFFLGTFFRAPKGTMLQVVTQGNWIVAMDSGEFVFEDARTNPEHTLHTGFWYVRSGTFRAKPHDYDPGNHLLQVRTAIARVFLRKAEIGMRVSESGGGQIWLVSGKATVVWNDGKKKDLQLRGMDYL